jgi:hypothetical protein
MTAMLHPETIKPNAWRRTAIGRRPARWLAQLVLVAVSALWVHLGEAAETARDGRGWEFEPYRIEAVIAIDAPGGMSERLANELPIHVARRAAAAIGPAWALNVQVAEAVQRKVVLSDVESLVKPPAAPFPTGGDKLLLIAVRWGPEGFELTAREFDHYVQRWGMPLGRQSRQLDMLAEQTFALAWQTLAPLAQLDPDANDPRRVVLQLRAAQLPRPDPNEPWAQAGDVFQPLVRRTTRNGELGDDGVQAVPWTYLEVVGSDGAAGAATVAQVHNGTRQALPARRQGRIEPVAIALRADPGESVLRLHARTAAERPLVGYEVFAQQPGEKAPQRIGSSDTEGRVYVPSGESRIRILFVKNGGQLLARFPLVPGAQREVDVPLPDDDMRLAAEARLAALREDVVDVVARRNILIARIRQKIEHNDFSAAQELLQALDELPGRAQFNLTLNPTARLLRSDDAQIQRRIDQLFEATRTVVNQYLDSRPIGQLHDELREAQRKRT